MLLCRVLVHRHHRGLPVVRQGAERHARTRRPVTCRPDLCCPSAVRADPAGHRPTDAGYPTRRAEGRRESHRASLHGPSTGAGLLGRADRGGNHPPAGACRAARPGRWRAEGRREPGAGVGDCGVSSQRQSELAPDLRGLSHRESGFPWRASLLAISGPLTPSAALTPARWTRWSRCGCRRRTPRISVDGPSPTSPWESGRRVAVHAGELDPADPRLREVAVAGWPGSRGGLDLYKKPNGDIAVKSKGGAGPGEPTGHNIKDICKR